VDYQCGPLESSAVPLLDKMRSIRLESIATLISDYQGESIVLTTVTLEQDKSYEAYKRASYLDGAWLTARC
jgi:hypothetical protein